MNTLFLCHGMGEFAQAESFARYLRDHRESISFLVTGDEKLVRSCQANGFPYSVWQREGDVVRTAAAIQPDVIIYCNSKTAYPLLTTPPANLPLAVSLDSNWLFNNSGKAFRVHSWLDQFFVVMPKRVFNLGLLEHGGHYRLSPAMKRKVFPVGFIPSGKRFSRSDKEAFRKREGVRANEKLVFLYVGGKWYLIPVLLLVLDELARRLRLKVMIVGSHEIPRVQPHYRVKRWFATPEAFELALASSDLVIQHHGLGTLPKVIRAQVPVICLTRKLEGPLPPSAHSAHYEIEPFAKLGVCRQLPYFEEKSVYLTAIRELLLSREARRTMQKAQAKLWEPGEERAYRIVRELLAKRQRR